MNEDSGGKADGKAYRLTAQEEAALLAEYGTEGLLEDGVDWAAPSHFKSELGDTDVFLTGAVAGTDDAVDDSNGSGTQAPAQIQDGATRAEYADPLTLYLLRHAPSLILPSWSIPEALAQPISNLIDAFEDTDGQETKRKSTSVVVGEGKPDSGERFARELRSGQEWERRASLAVHGIPTTAFAPYLLSREDTSGDSAGGHLARRTSSMPNHDAVDDAQRQGAEYNKLMGTTTQMLHDAEELLNELTKPVAETAEEAAEMQRCIEEMHRREALAFEDVVDQRWRREEVLHADEEDASTRELLQRAREGRKRLRDAFTSLAEPEAATNTSAVTERSTADSGSRELEQKDGVVQQTIKENEEGLSDMPQLNADYLYAFEMELPRSATMVPDVADTSSPDSLPEKKQSVLASSPNRPLKASECETPPTESSFGLPPESLANGLHGMEDDGECSIGQLILRSSTLLEAMNSTEQRDTTMLKQFTNAVGGDERGTQVPRRAGQLQKECGARMAKKSNRDALGLVTLPSFVERLDVLLSPTHDEQAERNNRGSSTDRAVDNAAGDSSSVKKGAQLTPCDSNHGSAGPSAPGVEEEKNKGSVGRTTATSPAAPSLEQIRQRAAIESFLLLRETEEGRRMRREDELMEREAQASEELRKWFADRLVTLQDDALQERNTVCAEEVAAFKELAAAQMQDAALARQVQQLRQLQQVEALAYTLMMEWEVHREQLVQEEALASRRLTRDEAEERAQAAATAAKREGAETAAAHTYLRAVMRAFETKRAALCQSVLSESGGDRERWNAYGHPDEGTSWYRRCVQPLLQERASVSRWAVTQHRSIEAVRDLLTEAEAQYRRHIRAAPKDAPKDAEHVLCVPAAPPAKMSASSTTATSVLTTEKLLHLLWPAFRAALLEPRQAAQYLARWSLSLEDIRSIDWAAMQSLVLLDSSEDKDQTRVATSQLVKDIDLSSNTLGVLDVLQAVRTFPLLQRLTLSHAELRQLQSTADFAPSSPDQQDQHMRKSASSARAEEDCRVSSASTCSSHLRHISAARNNALAEQVHLLEVDASSNRLTSLAPLGVMATASLIRCTAADNQLASLESVSACTQLRSVAVAHNKLASVQCLQGWRLLREMDVGNNELSHFDEDAKDPNAAAAAPPLLLSKLFLSHNHLKRLFVPSSPQLPRVYPCVSQLFLNRNELTSLDEAAMAWFPLLRVLQAEGNRLVDVSGLRHCTRLESVKLSYNQLSTVEALYPLASCRRLKVVDLSGNPLFPDAGSEEARQRVRFLCNLLPWLEELNNAPLRRWDANKEATTEVSATRECVTEESPASQNRAMEEAVQRAVATVLSVGLRATAADRATRPLSRSSAAASPSAELYAEVFAALCWDAVMQHTQEERELREALIARDLNRAKGWEATMMATGGATAERAESSGGPVVAALYGVTAAQRDTRRAEHEAELQLYQLDRGVLSAWLSVAEHCADEVQTSTPSAAVSSGVSVPVSSDAAFAFFSNRHEVHTAYRQREEDHWKKLARACIAEWLVARVLIRRARQELRALQAAHRQSEASRREAAARRIQPLWRGAALRSRLRRLLHGRNSEADDEDTFAKVNVNDWLTEDPIALAPVELLLHSVVDSAREVAAVPFDVPPVVAPLTKMNTTVKQKWASALPSSSPSTPFIPTPPNSEQRRVNTGTAVSGRPSLRLAPPPSPKPRSDSAGAAAGSNGSASHSKDTLDEQWGPMVAAQIRKKQQKSTRAHHERLRHEFMQDPLRVQQEMRAAHPGHKPK